MFIYHSKYFYMFTYHLKYLHMFIYLIQDSLEKVKRVLLLPDVDGVTPQLEDLPELLWLMSLEATLH